MSFILGSIGHASWLCTTRIDSDSDSDCCCKEDRNRRRWRSNSPQPMLQAENTPKTRESQHGGRSDGRHAPTQKRHRRYRLPQQQQQQKKSVFLRNQWNHDARNDRWERPWRLLVFFLPFGAALSRSYTPKLRNARDDISTTAPTQLPPASSGWVNTECRASRNREGVWW